MKAKQVFLVAVFLCLSKFSIGQIVNIDSVYSTRSVQDIPLPKDGNQALYKAINKNLKYPKEAKEHKKQGTVLVEFIVDENGKAYNFKALTNLGFGLETAALEALKATAIVWQAGIKDGVKVKVRLNRTVVFKLSEEDLRRSDSMPVRKSKK